MPSDYNIIEETEDLYRVVELTPFRRMHGTFFDVVPMDAVPSINAVDRVIHEQGAFSPGSVGDVERPWYMHPHQADNLLVLHGTRYVDIFTPGHGKVVSFVVEPNRVEREGSVIADGPAMLIWPRKVFHRIVSGEKGSASINLAVHYEGIDMNTNFNVYDLNTDTGRFTVLRKGHLDQMEQDK